MAIEASPRWNSHGAPRLIAISQTLSPEQLAYLLRHYSPAMINGEMAKFNFTGQ